ncbi:MAG TPA: hypothetical protein VMB71_06335 [Acetobacteraceae bacterium]|nr:hypothetical protein [Acetobacteraceae bacterium]
MARGTCSTGWCDELGDPQGQIEALSYAWIGDHDWIACPANSLS